MWQAVSPIEDVEAVEVDALSRFCVAEKALWRQALLKRAKANSQAQLGKYDPSSESSEAGERTYEKGYVY